jgi:hypothetical protein
VGVLRTEKAGGVGAAPNHPVVLAVAGRAQGRGTRHCSPYLALRAVCP